MKSLLYRFIPLLLSITAWAIFVILNEYMTQNFIQAIQSAQAGVRILTLGSAEQVLKSVGRKQLDLKAIQSIGVTYNVDALIYGQFTISELTPNFHISTIWQSVDAGAFVEASLITKLWDSTAVLYCGPIPHSPKNR